MENKEISSERIKYLFRKSILGGTECPYYSKQTETIKDKDGRSKVYCKRNSCPYDHLNIIKIESMDLEFKGCESGGLTEKVSFWKN